MRILTTPSERVLPRLVWRRSHASAVLTVLTLTFVMVGIAAGETRTWVAIGGPWTEPTNWSPEQVPTASVNAEINNGGTARLNGTGALGEVWQLYLGRGGSGNSGSLEITEGGVLHSFQVYIGETGIGTATVAGGGAQWIGPGSSPAIYELQVGGSGNGKLYILEGGKVASSYAHIAELDHSTGLVTVSGSGSGSGSTWNNSNWLIVGTRGNGTLQISGWGQVTADSVWIGPEPNSIGKVIMDGTQSKFTINGSLTAGLSGQGIIEINGGATLTTGSNWGSEVLGWNPLSRGEVFLTGASTWNNYWITVGNRGTGILKITESVVQSTWNGTIGAFADSRGEVTVTGPLSKWTNRSLTIGRNGTGILDITGGGGVESTGATSIIAGGQGSDGSTVTVDGQGSKWTNSKGLEIGGDHATLGGKGDLNIKNGGTVTIGETLALHETGLKVWNNGRVDISGTGSRLIVSSGDTSSLPTVSGIYVGSSAGLGQLEIVGGGKIDSRSTSAARIDGLQGTLVRVDGVDSLWGVPSSVTVGGDAFGELKITGGGGVSPLLGDPAEGFIGRDLGSMGVVTVSGGIPGIGDQEARPSFLSLSSLEVGGAGTGRLNITAGGLVGSTTAVVGNLPSLLGDGRVTINGTDSAWLVGTLLIVGNYGEGNVSITNGGKVQVQSVSLPDTAQVLIGLNSSGLATQGMVTVDGENSELKVDGVLTVGDKGNGALHITNGGHVENNHAFIGYDLGSQGTVLVDNATWLNRKTLAVGLLGSAVLNIRNGGVVAAADGVFIGPSGKLMGTGTITTDGFVFLEGIAAPGASPGTLHIDGSYEQRGSGRLQIELASTTNYDVLAVTGQANLGGTLEIILLDGFSPAPTDTFEFLTAASFAGGFADVIVSSTAGESGTFDFSFTPTGLALSNFQPATGLPGDYNDDNTVDAADYVVWRKGTATQTDYNLWRANFGQPAGSGGGASGNAAVPEPATLVLLTFAAAGWCLRRCQAA